MREIYKRRGETPLQALGRLREENPELRNETLSYAGRLDPMAEGVLPVLVGERENADRHAYLAKDKTYKAEFLLGCSSDTGDVLGIVQNVDFSALDTASIVSAVEDLSSITEQAYPWYSSKTVNGIPLFQYARESNFSIERPVRSVRIYRVGDIDIQEVDAKTLMGDYIRDIKMVEGDFRQDEICTKWSEILKASPEKVCLVTCELKVSSGTYIRGLAETLSESLGVPVLLSRLIRTKVV